MLSFMTATFAMAQNKQFTLEELNYGGKNYRQTVPETRYLTWWGDELVRTEAEYCSVIDKKTGAEKNLFTLADIQALTNSDEHNQMRHLYNAAFPYPDKTVVMLINGKERMLIDWAKKELLLKIDREGEAEDFSQESHATAYVKDDNLFVRTKDNKTHQLSTDGSREIVYGQSVHRDEFGITKGTFWSPKGNKLAFYRMDQSMVTDYPQVDIFNRTATYEPDKYPMAGETSHKVSIGVFNLNDGSIRYLETGDPTDRYFTNISWDPDEKTIYMFELNRDQNDCQLVSYDAQTGKRMKVLYQETNDKYVEPLHPITFLPWDNTMFVFQSQRDGYNHLYLYDTKKADGNIRQLTRGEWVVMEMLGFDSKAKRIIISSNECNPIQKNTWTVDVKSGKRTLIDDGAGWHYSYLSPSGQWIYDNYSEPDVPRKIDVTNTSKPKALNLLTASDPWKGYDVPTFTSGTIKAADGVTDLYYRMVKPHDFDETKKYPTVIYVYGGPHAHNVDARWHYSSRSWETYMAQKGYVLFILDNRGSENRGRDFEQVTFRQLGQEEMKDQMKGVEFLKSLPYIDQNRIGVHGWSYGGYMTISLMTNYPDVFKVGVAGGPVIDWKWYEVMYGERYMDTPQSNPEGYAKTSLLRQAPNLKGKLQIITGYNDKTVVPQHCLSFIAECIKAGTQPDFFVYPGEPHNMRGHQSVHLHERITQYFEDYLK